MMQKYVTPQPGRTPGANITDQDHYKLDVRLSQPEYADHLLVIKRWIPEHGWTKLEIFLTDAELANIRREVNQ
jgi:hypothetical protein